MVFHSKKKLRFIIPVLIFCVTLLSCKAKQVAVVQEKPKPETTKPEPQQQKKDTTALKTPVKGGPYNFLLMLPADLEESFVRDSLSPDSAVVKENFNKDLLDAVNFYEGALLAVDSLRKAGNDIKLKVVDLSGNEERQTTKLWIQKYDNVQVVFSMLKGKPLKTLSGILAVRKIPLISCAPNTYSFVEKNQTAVCVQPSSLTQCNLMGAYARDHFKSDNLIIVSGNSDKEKERSAAFLSAFQDTALRARIKKANFSVDSAAGVTKALSVTYTNTIFIPSTDEDFVTTIYSLLETYAGMYRFRIIGLPVWQLFESIDPRLLEKYNTTLFASEYYSYDENDVLQFRKKFRHLFSTEPGDEAYLAYDSFLQFGNLFIHKQLPFGAPEINLKGLRSKYYFNYVDSIAAENRYINILKIENFRYVKMSL